MHDTTKSAFSHRPDAYVATEGEFTGWRTWSHEGFVTNNGPFWQKQEDDGTIRCAFRAQRKHLNNFRHVHGGCLMAFADYCLFAFARPALQMGGAVTTNFACEFLDAGIEGDLIVGTGEVTRAGGSLIFLRGQLTAGERTLLTFSGTIKRIKRKPPPQPSA